MRMVHACCSASEHPAWTERMQMAKREGSGLLPYDLNQPLRRRLGNHEGRDLAGHELEESFGVGPALPFATQADGEVLGLGAYGRAAQASFRVEQGRHVTSPLGGR